MTTPLFAFTSLTISISLRYVMSPWSFLTSMTMALSSVSSTKVNNSWIRLVLPAVCPKLPFALRADFQDCPGAVNLQKRPQFSFNSSSRCFFFQPALLGQTFPAPGVYALPPDQFPACSPCCSGTARVWSSGRE